MNELLIRLLIGLVLAYIAFGFFLYFMQGSMIYYPDKQDFDSCTGFLDAKKIDVGGTRMYFKRSSEKIIVVYHGNAGSSCTRSFLKPIFEKYGYSYLFVEYAGYSNDNRRPTKALLEKDVENAAKFIESGNFSKVVVYGESIGSALASYHSSIAKVDSIVFIEPLDSIENFAKKRYMIYPIKLILKEDYDNIKMLKNYNGKITIIHGAADSIMNISHSQNLYSNIKTSNKKFIKINSAGHNDIYDFSDTIAAIEESIK